MINPKKVQLLLVSDTTGSVSPVIAQIRDGFDQLVTRGFREIPELEIGILVHGDYCDQHTSYVTKQHGFTSNLHGLVSFLQGIRATGGGDAPECYELALREARSFAWQNDTTKIIVLIGDEEPHAPSYHLNTLRIDWRVEARELAKMGVTVHTVQALGRRHASYFYQELAGITGGKHFMLNQFRSVTDYLIAIALSQVNQEAVRVYEQEVISSGRMDRGVDRFFATLNTDGRESYYTDSVPDDLVPVSPHRFQMLYVSEGASIRDFVESNELPFTKGKGFYEFTKTETIQANKEVVLRDRRTGDMFTGLAARKLLGLPEGVSARIKPIDLENFQVFIKSNSYNRKLVGNTSFLYEVDYSR